MKTAKEVFWDEKNQQYIVDNYGKLPTKVIAENIGTTPQKVICKAHHLRSKGKPVGSFQIIKWKNLKTREKLSEIYGSIPTHKVAARFKTTIFAIHSAARRLGIIFRGSSGRYTTTELAKILGIDEKTVKRWIGAGLRIRIYVKDGITKPRKPQISGNKPRLYCGLIGLDDLKSFFEKRPEAYNLNKLSNETKFILELHRIKEIWKQKEVYCKKCDRRFRVNLYDNHPRCPKCGKIAGKWAINYL